MISLKRLTKLATLTENRVAVDRDRFVRLITLRRSRNCVSSLEGQPGTNKSPREIERETGISRRTVQRIAKFDLRLKTFRRREMQLLPHVDRVKRFAACKRLSRRLTVAKLARTWFPDEKIFTVQTPTNSQNDQMYANVAIKRNIPSERLLKGRKLFSHNIIVSVAVSQLGKSSLVFVLL